MFTYRRDGGEATNEGTERKRVEAIGRGRASSRELGLHSDPFQRFSFDVQREDRESLARARNDDEPKERTKEREKKRAEIKKHDVFTAFRLWQDTGRYNYSGSPRVDGNCRLSIISEPCLAK